MAEQLVFELGREEPPSFDNFVAGPNVEVVAALRQFVREPADTGSAGERAGRRIFRVAGHAGEPAACAGCGDCGGRG